MSKKNKKLMCAVYLSVDAPDKEIQEKEEKQFRYIKDYCKGNGLKIVKSYHRAGLSRCEMSERKFMDLAKDAQATYKINQVVLVNCDILDEYLESFRITD